MILSFKHHFREPILLGRKIHTLRLDPNDRWKPGMSIQMATGVRSKNYNCFKEDTCTGIQYCYMSWIYGRGLEISIGDDPYCNELSNVNFKIKDLLCANDGFEEYDDFLLWFVRAIRDSKKTGLLFKMIHWTDFRYGKELLP